MLFRCSAIRIRISICPTYDHIVGGDFIYCDAHLKIVILHFNESDKFIQVDMFVRGIESGPKLLQNIIYVRSREECEHVRIARVIFKSSHYS